MAEILAVGGYILIFLVLLFVCALMIYRNGVQKAGVIVSVLFVIADVAMTIKNGVPLTFGSFINWAFILVMCYAIIAIGLSVSGKKTNGAKTTMATTKQVIDYAKSGEENPFVDETPVTEADAEDSQADVQEEK